MSDFLLPPGIDSPSQAEKALPLQGLQTLVAMTSALQAVRRKFTDSLQIC